MKIRVSAERRDFADFDIEPRQGLAIAVTGHRPQKLAGFTDPAQKRLVELAKRLLLETRPKLVYTGMALGWDQAVAEACILTGIDFQAAIPCDGQESIWPRASQVRYQMLLGDMRCRAKIVVTPGPYETWKMSKRNEWMVDRADVLLALWDGSSGGTANCVEYAKRSLSYRSPREIWNVWPEFLKGEQVHTP